MAPATRLPGSTHERVKATLLSVLVVLPLDQSYLVEDETRDAPRRRRREDRRGVGQNLPVRKWFRTSLESFSRFPHDSLHGVLFWEEVSLRDASPGPTDLSPFVGRGWSSPEDECRGNSVTNEVFLDLSLVRPGKLRQSSDFDEVKCLPL